MSGSPPSQNEDLPADDEINGFWSYDVADLAEFMSWQDNEENSDEVLQEGGGEDGDAGQGRPRPPRALGDLFPNTIPADIPVQRRVRVPERLRNYWDANIPDELKHFMLSNDDVFKPVCMNPDPNLMKLMCSKSKCMELLPPDDPGLLYLPTYGQTMCWIAMGGSGELPGPIQDVLYFFGQVSNSLGNYAHYVVPSIVTDVEVDRCDPKVIPGLVSTGEGLDPRAPKRHRSDRAENEGFVSIAEILAKRALDGSGTVKKVVPGVTVHVGNTGVVFKERSGKEEREIFTIAMVTVADNLAFWPYVEGKMLQRPPKSNPKYEELLLKTTSLRFILKKIMRYEIFHNMGILAEDFGMPEEYGMNSDNPLGPNTVLSMFQLPYKIFHMIRTEYPNADMSTLKIAGFPEMGFTNGDLVSKEMEIFMLKSIKMADMRDSLLMAELSRYAATKDKTTFDSSNLGAVAGWPLEMDDEGNILSYGLPPLPLMHRLDMQEVCGPGGVEEFVARLGGADGALPELSRAYMASFSRGSSQLAINPEMEHCISDKRVADPVTVLNHYYGGGVDVFQALIIVGRYKVGHDALKAEIKARRESGATPREVAAMYESYLGGVMQKLVDSINAGVFRSDTISQMLNIHMLVDFDDMCTKSANSIASVMKERGRKITKVRRYDGMFRAWYVFLDIWEEVNNSSFLLNSGNLICAIEILISQLMYKFADTNETWTFFFATILVMSGYGHFKVSTPNGIFSDTRKRNTTGLDYTANRAVDFWNTLYNRLLIPKNKRCHVPLNCARFTESVLKNITTATAAGNRLLTVPSSRTNFQVMYASEMRQSCKSVIQFGAARGEAGGNVGSFNSRERDDKLRELAEEVKVGTAAFLVMASNEKTLTAEAAENTDTLGVVCATLPSGVAAPVPITPIEQFNDKHTNTKGGRHRPMNDTLKEVMSNVLAFSQNFAGLCALTNLTSATSVEICPTSAAFYDWICYYIFQFTSTILDSFVAESFNRMKEGYKSREVVFGYWLKTMSALSKGMSKEEAAKYLLLDVGLDPFPIVSIPSAACGLLYRSIHMPSLIVTKVFGKHLWEQDAAGRVPTIKWEYLERFFTEEHAPNDDEDDPSFMKAFEEIKTFIGYCIRSKRFIPEDETAYDTDCNISCYISDSANEDLTPMDSRASIFRLVAANAKEKDDLKDLPHRVATKLHSKFGASLCTDCHMGPEVSVLKNALVYILDRNFRPDFRGLTSPQVFCSRKHLAKLGFLNHVRGMRDYTDPEAPAYAKQFICKVGNEVRSQGIGFNVWSLLTMNSLMDGSDPLNPHPNVSHVVTNNIMTQILGNAPPGSTPGNIVPLRCFSAYSSHRLQLYIPKSEKRPEHLWRPNEKTFMDTGLLPVAGAIGRFLPEDMWAIPGLSAAAQKTGCTDITETPPESYKSALNLMPNTKYPFIVPYEKKMGILEVLIASEVVRLEIWIKQGEREKVVDLEFDEWEDYLHDNNILLMPLITRMGAAALVNKPDGDGKTVGCLIPQEGSTRNMFDPENFTYQVLINAEMDVVNEFFTDIIREGLIAVGEIMYLDMEVLDDPDLRAQGGEGKLLYTRLTVPNIRFPEIGKLYVSCFRKPRGSRGSGHALESMLTLAVNPWDVQLASEYSGPQSNIMKHLI